jgi:hypothetical protein
LATAPAASAGAGNAGYARYVRGGAMAFPMITKDFPLIEGKSFA